MYADQPKIAPLSNITSVNILGVSVNAVDLSMVAKTIDDWIRNQKRHYVCLMNVHCIMESQRQPALRQVYQQAGLCTPDGMPLVWIIRRQGQPQVKRVYGPDLMTLLCSTTDYRHFLYGGSQQALSDLACNLQQRYPHLKIVGQISPPFRDLTVAEDNEYIRQMNASQPDIIWVGLGTPRQDFWMHQHRSDLNAPLLIGVGAAFDFLSGHKQQAPFWMQRNGLEWLFRLVTEPRRLWRRYLIDNPLFLVLILIQTLHLRTYNIERDAEQTHNRIKNIKNTGDL